MNDVTNVTKAKANGHAPRLCLCGCGEVVPAANRFSYLQGHRKQGKRAYRQAKAGERGCEKCGRVLRSDNTTGLCKTCRRKGLRATPKPKRATIKVPLDAGAPVLRSLSLLYSLEVSEPQLDRFLKRLEIDWPAFVLTLAPDLKLRLVNHYLSSEREPEPAESEVA